MKKKYIEPRTVIVSADFGTTLLVTSGDVYSGGIANSPELFDGESLMDADILLNDWQQEMDKHFGGN